MGVEMGFNPVALSKSYGLRGLWQHCLLSSGDGAQSHLATIKALFHLPVDGIVDYNHALWRSDSMQLSDGEKLIILMLADMYKSLKIKGDFDPKFISSTIHNDQLWGFNWQYTGIPFEPYETPHAVKQVADVLDMWFLIEEGYKKLSPTGKKQLEKDAEPFGKHVKFLGFDGNNETDFMTIASYLIDDMHRFTHFKGRDLNSHMPSMDGYLRMYRVFEPLRNQLHQSSLNLAQLTAILTAWKHP
jgi:uncharacterized protein